MYVPIDYSKITKMLNKKEKEIERLKKENEWLLNMYITDRFDKEILGAREYALRQMQHALKGE